MSSLKSLIDNINRGKGREYLTISQEGRYVLRVIQNLIDENEAPFEEFMLHNFYHPYYKKNANFRCIGHNCPLCAYAKEVEKKDKSSAWRFKATPYYIYNVIDRKDGKLKILKVSWTAHDAIKSKLIEAALDEVNLGHFKSGRDIEIEVRRTNDKFRYKAHILSAAESKPIAPKIIQELKLVKPLDEMYRLQTRDELVAISKGKVPDLPKQEGSRRITSKSSLIENLNKNYRSPESLASESVSSSSKVENTSPVVKKPTPTIIKDLDDNKDGGVMAEKLKKLDIFDTGDENE